MLNSEQNQLINKVKEFASSFDSLTSITYLFSDEEWKVNLTIPSKHWRTLKNVGFQVKAVKPNYDFDKD